MKFIPMTILFIILFPANTNNRQPITANERVDSDETSSDEGEKKDKNEKGTTKNNIDAMEI